MRDPSVGSAGVSVIVPTRGRKELLRKCLRSLREQDYPREQYEIIVVEDGTSEGRSVVESLSREGAPITYINIAHSGAASAYDAGLDHAKYEIVAFIDDDAIAAPNWLKELSSTLVNGREEKVVGVGGRISPDYPCEELSARLSNKGELIWSGSNVLVSEPQDVDFLPGANMAFWRSKLQEIGGFDCNFSRTISWRHETDVGLRARSRGYRLVYDPRLVVFHRAARWDDPIERVRPGVVWAMIRDDAYFRAKNFGWPGVSGAARAALRDARKRIVVGTANLLLVFAHLLAWIPGAWQGLRKKHRPLGTLSTE